MLKYKVDGIKEGKYVLIQERAHFANCFFLIYNFLLSVGRVQKEIFLHLYLENDNDIHLVRYSLSLGIKRSIFIQSII